MVYNIPRYTVYDVRYIRTISQADELIRFEKRRFQGQSESKRMQSQDLNQQVPPLTLS